NGCGDSVAHCGQYSHQWSLAKYCQQCLVIGAGNRTEKISVVLDFPSGSEASRTGSFSSHSLEPVIGIIHITYQTKVRILPVYDSISPFPPTGTYYKGNSVGAFRI